MGKTFKDKRKIDAEAVEIGNRVCFEMLRNKRCVTIPSRKDKANDPKRQRRERNWDQY